MLFGKPTGVVLLALFLIVAFCMDFYYGVSIVFEALPVPPVYAVLGEYYGLLLIFGGFVGLSLFYGILKLKNWARVILLIGFPAQVVFNIILDPTIFENYFLLALSLIIAIYLLIPTTRERFT
ncbi:MAG: hypothetical protein ACE5H4_15460 [Candidatus Thorarchaeota archaeon]